MSRALLALGVFVWIPVALESRETLSLQAWRPALFLPSESAHSTKLVGQGLPVESLPAPLDLMAIDSEGSKHLKVADIDERLRENGIRVRLYAPLDGATACVIKEVLRDLLAE